MKVTIFLVIAVSLTGVEAIAQHPLVGTWEMISVKGIGADGEAFFLDTTSVRETKIITPTHYMLIAWDVDDDSLMFNRTMTGQVRLEGRKYIEVPSHASVQIFENLKVDFAWQLEGDIFTQSGTIVRPDGKTVVLEALKFRRVTDVPAQEKNPAIGTWSQLTGEYQTGDGQTHAAFGESDQRLLIVTPTHWMRMDLKNKKFDGVLFGTYDVEGDTLSTTMNFATYPFKKGEQSKFVQRVTGGKLEISSTGVTPGGQPGTFHHVLEKVH